MSYAEKVLNLYSLGEVEYLPALEFQRKLQKELIAGQDTESLILCSHPPVITAGTSTRDDSFLVTRNEIVARGVLLQEIERGGDLTYHGPGQLVAYPILNLNHHKRDVHWYMRTLEWIIIDVINEFSVVAERIDGKTGVWIKPQIAEPNNKLRKIASIGVRMSRWCTLHGFALYVAEQSFGFDLINPCGFNDIEITSIAQELERSSNEIKCPTLQEVEQVVLERFSKTFGFSTVVRKPMF